MRHLSCCQARVVYRQRTDNSGTRKSGKIALLHPCVRGQRHAHRPAFLSASAGRPAVAVLPAPCPVAQRASLRLAEAPQAHSATTQALNAPHPCPGLLDTPWCDAYEQAAHPHPKAPGAPPFLLTSTRGRKRTIDTQQQCCPDQAAPIGWRGGGTLRSNGHPGGKAWPQCLCVSCHGYFQQTHGTLFHGTRVAPERLAWAVGALCEGWGIRARGPGA